MSGEVEKPRVDVAMATYKGGRYLSEMLASIAAQHWSPIRLIACDDGSPDNTVEVLEHFTDFPVELHRNPVNLGALQNFSKALTLTDAPYVALADQDDVWLPGKVEMMVARIRELEAIHGTDCPILVYSDLKLVDDRLNVIADSFYNGTFKSREARTIGDFTISNHVPGCASMMNRALLDLALPVPPNVHMHDWWLCLVAAAFGQIGHVEPPLLLFRRHGENETGYGRPKDRSNWIGAAIRRLGKPRDYVRERQKETTRIAVEANNHLATLQRRFPDRMTGAVRQTLDALTSRSWWRRYAILRQANSGESPVTDVLVTMQMGIAANRRPLDHPPAA